MNDSKEMVSDLDLDESGSLEEPLRRWERTVAVCVGIASGGAGAYAVFASSNQAGTAVLLVASVVFLLIGIQGTPLIHFASGSNSVELERRRRVQRALKRADEEDNLDKAAGIVEGAAIAEPHLVPMGALYEHRLAGAIADLGYRVARETRHLDFDFLVQDDKNRRVFVEAKYYREGASKVYNTFVAHLLMKIGPPDNRNLYGRRALLVSNAPLSKISEELIERDSNVISFVIWRDERDNDDLSEALVRTFLKI